MSKIYEYKSGLAEPIQALLEEKRALGYKYEKEAKIFWEMDRVMIEHGVVTPELPRHAVEKWVEKRPNEKRKNQKYRLNFTKRFAAYLQLKGYPAYYPDYSISARDDNDFTPYIFSNEELAKIMNYFESMAPSNQYPKGHIVWPMLFKTLICCGLRAGEAAGLRVKDVDLENGVLLIREAKHGKTRQVPLSDSLWADYIIYSQEVHELSQAEEFFFPNARGNPHHTSTIYKYFRDALWHSGIPHRGRGYGPRVHDLRHTFSVRCMQKIGKSKGDIVSALPYLSAYLGHYNMNHTQVYLRLIAENYPELIRKQRDYLGDTIPTWEVPREDK